MTKAQETKQRRAAVLLRLGAGWKAFKGVEGAKDIYKCRDVVIMPQRTIDGNFYVGSRRCGLRYTQTITEAIQVAKQWAAQN